MMCHTTACWLVVNNETLIRAVRRNFCGGNYRGTVWGGKEGADKGVTLLAEIIDPVSVRLCPPELKRTWLLHNIIGSRSCE